MGKQFLKILVKMRQLFPLILILANASSVPLTKELTPSWHNICGGTYLFSEDTKSWDDATGNCELYGSHLLQIDGFEENFCLLEYAHSRAFQLVELRRGTGTAQMILDQ